MPRRQQVLPPLALALLMVKLLVVVAQDLDKFDIDSLRNLLEPNAIHSRVIGGNLISIEKLGGYLVSLRYENAFMCGGALLKDRIVLTAAHCFLGRQNIKQWTIRGGISSLEEFGTQVTAENVIIPQSFSEKELHMDVAVVLLEKPLRATNIKTIKLCRNSPKVGDVMRVSGWGLTNIKQWRPQRMLQTVMLPLINKRECKRVYKSVTKITDSMLCASVLGLKDACTYDSGGPLVFKNEVCGIVSFGIGCASVKYPGIYTDIMYAKPFIKNAIQSLINK